MSVDERAVDAGQAARAPSRALESREFAKVATAQGLSMLGSQLAFVALPLAVYATTGSAAAAGVVGVTNALTRTVTALFSGAIVDRLRPVAVMVACDLGRLVANLVLCVILVTGWGEHVVVFCLLVVVEASLSALFTPAETVTVRRIVAPERLVARLARTESVTWTAALVGPPLGGALFAVKSALPFLGNAASYLTSALLLITLRRRRERDPDEPRPRGFPSPRELSHGLRLVLGDTFLRQSAVQVALHNIALGALSILVVVGAQQRGVAGGLIGVMVGVQAIGAIAGSLCTTRFLRRFTAGEAVLATGWSWILLMPFITLARHWLVLTALLTVLWFMAPIQRAVIGAYQGQRMPLDALGRVNAAYSLLTGSLAAIGPGIGGALLAAGRPWLAVAVLLTLTLPPVLWSTLVSRIRPVTLDLG
jgi:hypothetical protein